MALTRRVPRPYTDKKMSSLGQRMERARVLLGEAEGREVSWSEVERRARLGKGYLSKVRYGERQDLAPAQFLRIANALGVDVTWLTFGFGRMYPPRQVGQVPENDSDPPPSETGPRPCVKLRSDS